MKRDPLAPDQLEKLQQFDFHNITNKRLVSPEVNR
jgi:hypothetical protein